MRRCGRGGEGGRGRRKKDKYGAVRCGVGEIVLENAVTNRSKISSEFASSGESSPAKAFEPIRVTKGNRPETFKTPP